MKAAVIKPPTINAWTIKFCKVDPSLGKPPTDNIIRNVMTSLLDTKLYSVHRQFSRGQA